MPQMPLDPMVYVAKATRDDEGKIRNLEVIYESESVHIEGGEEFITFTTKVLLENPPPQKEG